jgi:hypothetical protein
MAAAMFAANLVIANRPRWTLLTVTYGAAWLYHAVVLILPDFLSDSTRRSCAGAMGIANTSMTPLQLLHIPLIGTVFCGFVVYISSRSPDAVRVSNEVD